MHVECRSRIQNDHPTRSPAVAGTMKARKALGPDEPAVFEVRTLGPRRRRARSRSTPSPQSQIRGRLTPSHLATVLGSTGSASPVASRTMVQMQAQETLWVSGNSSVRLRRELTRPRHHDSPQLLPPSNHAASCTSLPFLRFAIPTPDHSRISSR